MSCGKEKQIGCKKKFFHELDQEEIDKIVEDDNTIEYVLANFKQPDWCSYPNALEGTMGCWSLMDFKSGGLRTKISKEYCSSCDEFIN